MQKPITLLGYNFRDARAFAFKIINDILGLVEFLSVLKNWIPRRRSEGVGNTMGGNGFMNVVDNDLLRLQFNLPILHFCIAV
jgi:hypothetical protein